MDASYFKHLMNTDHYAPADLDQVNDLCRNYPMFNLAHMLKVRIRESLGYEKEKELKVAAVYAADRRKLFGMVNAVMRPVEVDDESSEEDTIVFSKEEHPEVDVIIEQHAPYAGVQPDEEGQDLLELEDEPDEENEMSSETLIEAVAKDDIEMEEPDPVKETPVIDEIEPDEEEDLPESIKLIQSFLREDPGPIRADKSRASNRDVSIASIQEHDGFITDTLAKIYVKQGLYAKAIYAYEKLSLKYPEKSAYFAAQIEKISNINHS